MSVADSECIFFSGLGELRTNAVFQITSADLECVVFSGLGEFQYYLQEFVESLAITQHTEVSAHRGRLCLDSATSVAGEGLYAGFSEEGGMPGRPRNKFGTGVRCPGLH
jgi:hypothetical protein